MRKAVLLMCVLAVVAAGCDSDEPAPQNPIGTESIPTDPCNLYKRDMRLIMNRAAALTNEAIDVDVELADDSIDAVVAAGLYEEVAEGFAELEPELTGLGTPPSDLAEPARIMSDVFVALETAYNGLAAATLAEDTAQSEQRRADITEGHTIFNTASAMLPGTCP